MQSSVFGDIFIVKTSTGCHGCQQIQTSFTKYFVQSLCSLKTECFKAVRDDIYCTYLHIQAHISKDINIQSILTNYSVHFMYIHLYCNQQNQQKLNKYYYGNVPAYDKNRQINN